MSKNVLLVLHEARLGGASNAVFPVLAAMETDGWSFSIWTPQPGSAAELLRRRGYRVAGEPRPMRYSWGALAEPPGRWARLTGTPGYLARFRRHVIATAPDLVHVNTLVALPEALAARATGAPTLLHVHEMLPDDSRGRVAAKLLRLMDGVVAVSDASASPLRRNGVSAGVVTAGVAPQPRRAEQARSPLVVGTLATVSKRKGSDLFVEAAARLLAERSDVVFHMAGPLATGAEAAWARELVARAEDAGVRWTGPADTFSALREWDVFVLPTRRDPFPLVVLEAMAAGVPVVVTRVDGVKEQVDADSGVLVEANDPVALRAAIAGLLDDPERRASLARAATARVEAKFTRERHAHELRKAYRDVVGAAQTRPRQGYGQ